MSQFIDIIRGARELPEGTRIALAVICMLVIAPLVFLAWQTNNSTQLAALPLSPVAAAPVRPQETILPEDVDNPSPLAVVGSAISAAGEAAGPGIAALWQSFLDGASYTAGGVASGVGAIRAVAGEAVGNIFR